MYDKFIGVNCLDENHLICVVMNINQNVENRGKTTKETIALQGFGWVIRSILNSLRHSFMSASVVSTDNINAIKYSSQQ